MKIIHKMLNFDKHDEYYDHFDEINFGFTFWCSQKRTHGEAFHMKRVQPFSKKTSNSVKKVFE